MPDRTIFRLRDILDAIDRIDALLENETFESMSKDHARRAAFERFLEILSEASRHIPDELKEGEPELPWRRIADIGNHLRHAYHRVDAQMLWQLWEDGELGELKAAVTRMVEKLEGA